MIILEHAQSDPVHRRWERAHKCVVQLVRQPCAPRLRCRAEVQQFILMSSSEAGNLPARSDTDKDSRGFVRDFRSPARADGVAWERVLILAEMCPSARIAGGSWTSRIPSTSWSVAGRNTKAPRSRNPPRSPVATVGSIPASRRRVTRKPSNGEARQGRWLAKTRMSASSASGIGASQRWASRYSSATGSAQYLRFPTPD